LFSIKLEWLSHGDPNDHHAVMPCAPDKVPDYSLEVSVYHFFRFITWVLNFGKKTGMVRGRITLCYTSVLSIEAMESIFVLLDHCATHFLYDMVIELVRKLDL